MRILGATAGMDPNNRPFWVQKVVATLYLIDTTSIDGELEYHANNTEDSKHKTSARVVSKPWRTEWDAIFKCLAQGGGNWMKIPNNAFESSVVDDEF